MTTTSSVVFTPMYGLGQPRLPARLKHLFSAFDPGDAGPTRLESAANPMGAKSEVLPGVLPRLANSVIAGEEHAGESVGAASGVGARGSGAAGGRAASSVCRAA